MVSLLHMDFRLELRCRDEFKYRRCWWVQEVKVCLRRSGGGHGPVMVKESFQIVVDCIKTHLLFL